MNLTARLKPYFNKDLGRHCVVSVITAWCFATLVNMLRLSSDTFNPVESLATARYTNIFVFVLGVLALSAALFLLSAFAQNEMLTDGLMFAAAFACGLVLVLLRQELYTCIGVTGLVLLAFSYFSRNVTRTDIAMPKPVMIAVIAVSAVAIAVFIGVTAVYRYLMYSVPNYDGGLFLQMFYYMKNHLTMQTTLERGELMSHMSVHVSPDFWLIMPLYFLFPYNQTIQISQGIVLALAVIPLALLCRRRGISRFKTAVFCAIYCFMPYVAGGCGYDIHENIFLPLAIFCLLYAFESDSWVGVILSELLLLGVKEDAAVYSGFIGLYMLVSRGKKDKTYIKAIAVMAVSVLYFAAAVAYIQQTGMNTATERFNNMISDRNGNLLGIIPTMLMNPGYTIKEIINYENISYIITVLAPMLFIPLFVKDYSLYILAVPFAMFNLMPSYEYMHDIGFQYTFGSASLLLYMTVVSIDTMKRHNPLKMICMCAVATIMFFTSEATDGVYYLKISRSTAYQQICEAMDEALALIPEDASVTAGTYICSRLSQRDVLYEDAYTDKETEYLALDLRGTDYDYDITEFYTQKGYTTIAYTEGIIAVFKKN